MRNRRLCDSPRTPPSVMELQPASSSSSKSSSNEFTRGIGTLRNTSSCRTRAVRAVSVGNCVGNRLERVMTRFNVCPRKRRRTVGGDGMIGFRHSGQEQTLSRHFSAHFDQQGSWKVCWHDRVKTSSSCPSRGSRQIEQEDIFVVFLSLFCLFFVFC